MSRANEELPESKLTAHLPFHQAASPANDTPSKWQQGGGEPLAAAAKRNHAGKGPRNYRRSDTRIQEDVCELLTKNADIDASGIEVSVGDGRVLLRGVVESPWAKAETETEVRTCAGVRDVINELKTQRPD